jgi:crossover junction endodeoxyribonuclease RusA
MIELELPWPPSVNNYKRVGKTLITTSGKTYQQRYNSPETKRFYYEVWVKIRSWIAQNRTETPLPATIALDLTIGLHPPDKRRRDIDNNIKIILDSLVRGGLLVDDVQIARLLIERREIISQGKVIVTIRELQCT